MTSPLYASASAAWIVLVGVNYASGAGWFGETNAQVSDRYPTLLTPSGWAFSIWGIIFLGQGAACCYLFYPSPDNTAQWKAKAADKVLGWWILGWLNQCLWQICFTQVAPIYMAFCVVFLVGALLSFQKGLSNLHSLQHPGAPPLPSLTYALYFGTTSINAAWLSVATAVGILIAITTNSKVNQLVFAVLLSQAVVALGVHLTLKYHDVFYSITLLWAFAAVYGGQRHAPWVVRALIIADLVVLMPVTLSAVLRRRSRSRAASPTSAQLDTSDTTLLTTDSAGRQSFTDAVVA